MTPEEELARAQECQQILSNKHVREALGSIREALVEQWQRTPVKDSDLREKIWAIYCAAMKFEQILQSHIETGKMAAIQVNESPESVVQRLKRAFQAV